MEEFLCLIDMYFHPLMELKRDHIKQEKILSRQSIKLLTYNLFLRPPPLKNNDNDWKDERMIDFVKTFENFDIICLQELFGTFNSRKQQLIRLGSQSGLFFFCVSPSPSFFSKFLIDSGLLIMSRFPIVETEFHPYTYGLLADSLSSKGVLYAKIKIETAYLMLFNTHLQATYFGLSDEFWNSTIQARSDQSDELLSFICDKIHQVWVQEGGDIDNYKIILVGDFNIDAHNYSRIREHVQIPTSSQTEYEMFAKKIQLLGEVNDLMKKSYGDHPFTFGYNGHDMPIFDQVLTAKEDIGSDQTLDYIWEIIPKMEGKIYESTLIESKSDIKSSSVNERAESLISIKASHKVEESKKRSKLVVNYTSPSVEQFLINDRPYQQLSDHFGLSMELNLQDSLKDIN